MMRKIKRELSTYFIDKETGTIYFSNPEFENGTAVLISLDGTDKAIFETGKYHVIPGYAIEFLFHVRAEAAGWLLSGYPEIANAYSAMERKIKRDLFSEVNFNKIYLDILGHFRGIKNG
jgi:hypothetical protein